MDIPAEMVHALEEQQVALLSVDGVNGLEIGLAESGESLAFRILVADPSDPPSDLPENIGEFAVRVIAGSPSIGSLPDRKPYDPVVGGVEVSRTTGTPILGGQELGPGTLGCVVRDVNGNLRGLSCAHVLCGSNPLSGNFKVGDPIHQPAPTTDPPPSKERIGNLADWRFPNTPPLFGGGPPADELDAAVCTIELPRKGGEPDDTPRTAKLQEVVEIGAVQGWRSPIINDNVRKRGMETGEVTYGTVRGQLGSYLAHDKQGNPLWWMLGQTRIEVDTARSSIWSLPGDSGSLVIDRDSSQVLGLHWGGEPGGAVGYATDIFTILTLLGLTIT